MKLSGIVLSLIGLVFCAVPVQGAETLRISSTIGPVDAGMLPLLADTFSRKTGIEIVMEKAGTGKTLKNAESGNFDLVMVHARKLEDAFCAAGFGTDRRDVMYNDFVILGPKNDPAGVKGLKKVTDAMKKLAAAKVPFVSRGDKSGTHVKEMELWAAPASVLRVSGTKSGKAVPRGTRLRLSMLMRSRLTH